MDLCDDENKIDEYNWTLLCFIEHGTIPRRLPGFNIQLNVASWKFEEKIIGLIIVISNL